MNGINIYSIVVTVLMVIFGFVSSYIKTKSNLIAVNIQSVIGALYIFAQIGNTWSDVAPLKPC